MRLRWLRGSVAKVGWLVASVATVAKLALAGCVAGVGRLRRLRSWCRSVAAVAKLGFDSCDNCIGLLQRPTVFFTNVVFFPFTIGL
jgi:hypothetical protein